ncbi:leucine zipper protein 1 [Rattus norvegicus]|uniref:Leucine zipper protein 1 n=1 Tax=Rattus norvegicus TaxID=10116 RepID=A6ITB6_RAT|nr:leucine zipper protein 1 [Rattus norvegicus]
MVMLLVTLLVTDLGVDFCFSNTTSVPDPPMIFFTSLSMITGFIIALDLRASLGLKGLWFFTPAQLASGNSTALEEDLIDFAESFSTAAFLSFSNKAVLVPPLDLTFSLEFGWSLGSGSGVIVVFTNLAVTRDSMSRSSSESGFSLPLDLMTRHLKASC